MFSKHVGHFIPKFIVIDCLKFDQNQIWIKTPDLQFDVLSSAWLQHSAHDDPSFPARTLTQKIRMHVLTIGAHLKIKQSCVSALKKHHKNMG